MKSLQHAINVILFLFFHSTLLAQGWQQINPPDFGQVRGFRAFEFSNGEFEIYLWNSTKGYKYTRNQHFDSTFVYWSYWCSPYDQVHNRLTDIAKPFQNQNSAFNFFVSTGCIVECFSSVYSDSTGNSSNQEKLIEFDDFLCAGLDAAIVASKFDENVFYFSFLDSIYFSSDRGQTIVGLSSPDSNEYSPSLTNLFLSPFFYNVLFTTGYLNTPIVYYSHDGGNTWQVVLEAQFNQMEFHPTDPNMVFAAAEDGLYKSNDGGISWDQTEYGAFLSIEIDSESPDTLFAGTQTGELFVSTDAGETWTLYNNTFSRYGILGIYKETNNDSLFVATRNGIFRVFGSFVLDLTKPENQISHRYELFPIYPNPFNPITTIKYFIGFQTNVEIVVFNALGQQVQTLVNEKKSMGSHTVIFNASSLSSGMYYFKINTNRGSQIRTATLLK